VAEGYRFWFLLYNFKSVKISRGSIRWTNLQKPMLVGICSPFKANSFKWNVDGSSLGKPRPSSIGGVLQNYYGSILGIFSMSTGILESNETELRVVVKAIKISASNPLLHHKHIIIESNSSNVISWMNNPNNISWLHHKLFSSAKRLTLCLGSIIFIHSHH